MSRSRGSTFKRCGCRDRRTGRQLGRRCPRLRERGHGSWYLAVELSPYQLMAVYGPRRGETVGLRWRDTRFADATLTVSRQLQETNRGGVGSACHQVSVAGRRRGSASAVRAVRVRAGQRS